MGTQFVKTELKLAWSYLEIAAHSFAPEQRKNMCRNARRSYDTILHALSQLTLSDKDRAAVDVKLDEIQTRLEHFGMADPIPKEHRRRVG